MKIFAVISPKSDINMMKRTFTTLFAAMLLCTPVMAENAVVEKVSGEEATQNDTKKKKKVQYNEKGEIIKTGINFGPLPVVAFDADRGFQYGALLNLYNFGDGSTYPNPKSTWYFEASAYTKGTTQFIVNYDNTSLFPGIRMSVCTGYYGYKALDFYGFNGHQSKYFTMDSDEMGGEIFQYTDDKAGEKLASKGKMPKGFYRHGRQLIKAKVDFTGEIVKNLYWEAGYNFMWTRISPFKPEGYTVFANEVAGGTTLYELYRDWGIISEDEAEGGIASALRVGLMYDSRNVENNPTRGIWAEAHLAGAPKWLGTTHEHYKLSATMRQYIPLGTEKLVFAYRLGYEGFIGNKAPWYLLPYYTNMGPKADNDGFGGYRTVRGLMLNRVQGMQTGFYNIELRWRFIDFKLFNQNIAFAVSGFTDAAHVFKGYDLTNRNEEKLAIAAPQKNELYKKFIDTSKKDGFHGSAGAGLRFIMNQNFIVALEYARCFNRQDGAGAFYINTGFLF